MNAYLYDLVVVPAILWGLVGAVVMTAILAAAAFATSLDASARLRRIERLLDDDYETRDELCA
jgi:hypothetical protein